MKRVFKTISIFGLVWQISFANSIDSSIQTVERTIEKLKTYQKKIDKNENQREVILNEYKYTNKSIRNNKKYNTQLNNIIASQEKEIKSLNQQIIDIEETQKNIFPLMLNMIDSLEVLVQQDTPFLLIERTQRVERLKKMLDKADIQTHEKYRIILEAFKIEYDYARNIETYQEKIENKTYNFLRIGRVALYYQSLDQKKYGYFNKQNKTWKTITDSTSKSNIRKAIKIAKKQKNVEFLNLPFLAKKENR